MCYKRFKENNSAIIAELEAASTFFELLYLIIVEIPRKRHDYLESIQKYNIILNYWDTFKSLPGMTIKGIFDDIKKLREDMKYFDVLDRDTVHRLCSWLIGNPNINLATSGVFQDARSTGIHRMITSHREQMKSHQVEIDYIEQPDEGLIDIWNEMSFALKFSKDVAAEPSLDEHTVGDECDHSLILKDDVGYVCHICGFIERSIESIIDFQYLKAARSTRTYSSDDIDMTEICLHPRHRKQMNSHQVEGFNFLVSNLSREKGGCIVAHAPGSGITFMIISFLQSFMANNDRARPLVVLPRGILATWKKEFLRWQVDEIPL